ncbi:MAG TPA: sialidase family protein [Egibacteraceae bacterium]|nr:sialidase family protein [Egibacteraceae bacterium]
MARLRIVALGSVLLLLAGATAASAGAFAQGPLVAVSGASPFNACTDDDVGSQPGTVFPDSEVEPYVDVNPTDPDNIIGVWQQDRWSNGGARGNVAGVSMNGGASWSIVPLPGVTLCTGGAFQRASDPWVSFAPDGTAYAMSLVLDISPPAGSEGGFGPNGMVVNRSTDGGVTWGPPTTLVTTTDPRTLHDKNSLTADPTDADFAYAVWDRLRIPQGAVVQPENAVAIGFKGPILFTRTTDGGDSWETPRVIYDPGGINQTIGNQIVVHPDGTVINFFNEILNFRNDDGGSQFDFNLALLRSPDKGETWLPTGRPLRVQKMQPAGVTTPDSGTPVRAAAVLFDVAVDASSGALYAVWQDARFTGTEAVAFSMSNDGGFTWTAPIKINQTPTNISAARQQAFIPEVAVTGSGVVAVSYYDFRNDVAGPQELADHWLVHCHAACSDPVSWADETRVTDVSFDYAVAPFANGLFLGDYVGLGTDQNGILPLFSVTTATDPANVVFRRHE